MSTTEHRHEAEPHELARLAALEARLAALEARLAATEARLAVVEGTSAPVPKKPAPVRRPGVPRLTSTAIAILDALTALGGTATIVQIRDHLPTIPHSSIRRTCQELRNAGKLRQIALGTYAVVTEE